MNAQQKLKHIILALIAAWGGKALPDVTAENIDDLYDEADSDQVQDAKSVIRSSGVETGLPTQSSRHYECEEVAAQAPDGSWVGWTYWHGGGKHGEPESIDWMEHAYDLNVTQVEKMTIVRNFAKA
jgi:hypothetical protein